MDDINILYYKSTIDLLNKLVYLHEYTKVFYILYIVRNKKLVKLK